MSQYRTADHVVRTGFVHINDHEGDHMGTMTEEEFFGSAVFPLWERTSHADFICMDGEVHTFQLDITQ